MPETTADRPRPGNVTLADVARRAGVSARTVSRVVNGEGGCGPATRFRILGAIDELGYRPNLMARGLIRRRSDTIGLVTVELVDPFFPEFAEGVQRAADELGRTMFLASTASDRNRQERALRSLHGHGVDGVIVFPSSDSEGDLVRLAAVGLPIVVVNSQLDAPGIAWVAADIRTGARLAVEHLVGRGRRRIALLIDANARHRPRAARREQGYTDGLTAAGLTVEEALIVEAPNSIVGGREGCARALALDPLPDAVFAYNDLMALGAMQELLSRGVKVPDDIAVVGFDDIAICEAVTPRLTSVRIDRDQLGRCAVEALQRLLDQPDAPIPTTLMPVELVARDSS